MLAFKKASPESFGLASVFMPPPCTYAEIVPFLVGNWWRCYGQRYAHADERTSDAWIQ